MSEMSASGGTPGKVPAVSVASDAVVGAAAPAAAAAADRPGAVAASVPFRVAGATGGSTALHMSMPSAPAAASGSSAPSDEQLVEDLRNGSTSAGEVLVKRYYQPL